MESDVPAEVEATFKAVFRVIKDTKIESYCGDEPPISMYGDNVGRKGNDGTLPVHFKCHTAVMDTLIANVSHPGPATDGWTDLLRLSSTSHMV